MVNGDDDGPSVQAYFTQQTPTNQQQQPPPLNQNQNPSVAQPYLGLNQDQGNFQKCNMCRLISQFGFDTRAESLPTVAKGSGVFCTMICPFPTLLTSPK
jgi:hypothetical protein